MDELHITSLALPPAILAHTGGIATAERQVIGEGSFVYILTGERGRYVLKVDGRREQIALREREAAILVALCDQRPFVAELLARADQRGRSYFLFSYLPGEDMVHALQHADAPWRDHLIQEYGRTLRRIHAWRPDLPRPDDWIGDALERAERNIATWPPGSTGPAEGDYGDRDVRELLAELCARRNHLGADIVFCHGDYCLPNLLVQEGQAVGVIDWPDAGYADRRLDLATALWSIGYNLHDRAYRRTFLEAYGYGGSEEELEFFEVLYALL